MIFKRIKFTRQVPVTRCTIRTREVLNSFRQLEASTFAYSHLISIVSVKNQIGLIFVQSIITQYKYETTVTERWNDDSVGLCSSENPELLVHRFHQISVHHSY